MANTPLAERLRPKNLEQFIGQKHLIGPGRPLTMSVKTGSLQSMILWGPPGTGKTTLARILASASEADLVELSAVLSGVKDIRAVVSIAKKNLNEFGRQTIIFVDEVHRFNKSQQDAFLPHVESGLLTFIGATTENPSFEVNNALLSRAAVYVLSALSTDELKEVFDRGVESLEILGCINADAKSLVIEMADGDARKLLNIMDLIGVVCADDPNEVVDAEYVKRLLPHVLRRYDKQGDFFYDSISALHKAVRGSAPDASLYWFTRMVDGGADPLYIGRRMIRMAVEDVGLADPRALTIALDAVNAYERLGSPEGDLALAHCVIYLSCAPKSNAVYTAYNSAIAFVKNSGSSDVPFHLRNASSKLAKDLGHSEGYRYPHDEADGYAPDVDYFPKGIESPIFYYPVERGLEIKIKEKLEQLRKLDSVERRRKIKRKNH